MSSSITGELITESLDYDGGRQVTAYVPPVAPEAVVFAVDGQLISQWGGVLEAATRWAVALREAGADVVMTERARVARRRVLERRVPADGGVGVRALSRTQVIAFWRSWG